MSKICNFSSPKLNAGTDQLLVHGQSMRLIVADRTSSGVTLRVWHHPQDGLVGTIGEYPDYEWIAPEKICNAFNPLEKGNDILARLGSVEVLAHLKVILRGSQLFLMPPLEAAGLYEGERNLEYPEITSLPKRIRQDWVAANIALALRG